MKIFSLKLTRMAKEDYVAFMMFCAKALTLFAVIGEKFPKAANFFLAAYRKLDEAYQKVNRSFITKQIQEANEVRDVRFRSLHDMLNGAAGCAEAAKAEAAKFLLEIVKDYGGGKIPYKRVDAKSAVYANLVEDFLQKYAAKVTAAGVEECVNELKQANDEYIRLRSDRTLEVSEQDKAEFLTARNDCTTAWHGLIDSVNWAYFYDKDELLLPFMKYMNTEIDWWRAKLKQKPGNPNTNPDGGSEEDEEDEETTEPTNPPTQEPETPGTQEPETPGTQEPTNPNPDNSGDNGNNGNYPPGYDPDADDDPGV